MRFGNAVLDWYQDELDSRNRDFYRCYMCGTLFTREREIEIIGKLSAAKEEDEDIKVCACGSRRYSPSWPVWYEWAKPSVLRYTIKLILARGVAPWAKDRAAWMLPYLSRVATPRGWGE